MKETEDKREFDRKSTEKELEGEWCYNPANDEWYWTGESEPLDYTDDGIPHEEPTEEEKKRDDEFQQKEWELYFNRLREERKAIEEEKRRAKIKERREAMRRPVKPPPVQELCEYEKLRLHYFN